MNYLCLILCRHEMRCKMSLLISFAGLVFTKVSYEIMIIEQEQVPLAGRISHHTDVWLFATIAIIATILVGTACFIYFQICRRYQERLDAIYKQYGMNGYRGCNLYQLRQVLGRIEEEILDMQEIAF